MSENDNKFTVYREISESAAKQISESRTFFEKMYKTTIGAVLLIATVGIGFFFWFVGQKYRILNLQLLGRRIREDE